MVFVLDLALREIVGESYVVVGRHEQTSAVAAQPFADRADFLLGHFQARGEVVEPEHQQRVGVVEDALVDRLWIAGLVDPLEHRHGMAGEFPGEVLKGQRGAVEEFQRSGDALQKVGRLELRFLVGGVDDVADLGDGGEAIGHRSRIPLSLPGVTPGPVDADAPSPVVRPGDVVLVIGPRRSDIHRWALSSQGW